VVKVIAGKVITVIHSPCKTYFQELLPRIYTIKHRWETACRRVAAAPFCGYDFGNRFCSLFLLWEICVICAQYVAEFEIRFLRPSKKLNRKVSSNRAHHHKSAGRAHRDHGGKRVLNMCANNYLGLADHPALIAAAKEALDTHGFGMASVRFICGTQDIHKDLNPRSRNSSHRRDNSVSVML